MPFTLSHPAAIIPFYKWFGPRLPLSALVIGSIAPDFAYFIPGALGPLSHSIPGLFYFCLPSGLVVFLIFQHVLKQPSIALLPKALRERIPPSPTLSRWTYFGAAFALLVGAATHILWDSFTHLRSSLFGVIPLLQIVVDVGGEPLRVYKLLQHTSTAIGLAVIAIWLYRIWRSPADQRDTRQANTTYPIIVESQWRTGFFSVIAASSALGAFVKYVLHPSEVVERNLYYLAIGGMTGFAVAWVFVSVVVTVRYDVGNR